MGGGKEGLSISVVLGHNASKWLAIALNRQHVRGYHERLYRICRFGRWYRMFRYQLEHPIYAPGTRPYWEAVEKDIREGYHVFDSNVWPAYLVPALNDYHPLENILYVTRNGIRWMRSVSEASAYSEATMDFFGINEYLRKYWTVMGKPWRKNWKSLGRWERLCLYWSTSYYMANWLEDQGLTIHRFRMEDLVGGIDLYKVYELFGISISEDRVQRIQQHNVNQHIEPMTVRNIWRSWSHTQREIFREFCGEGMSYYGYQIW